ncbi:MAG: C69 family dipeptidase [Pirellulales bacterium]
MPRTALPALLLVSAILWAVAGREARPCTSIMVGRKASVDGSVMTSHTCDSHRDGSRIVVVSGVRHAAGAQRLLTRRRDDDTGPMPRYARTPTGNIPEAAETLSYIAPVYAAMNERQLAIGESTFEGREELVSQRGLIDCETLTRLMLERATTARQAIQLGGQLLEKYGWCDVGEALTIADTKEVWLMEIVGPGQGIVGAVWVAQRVPDDHVSVVANGARIGEIDLAKADFFMASSNIFKVAEERGYWDSKSGQPFRFYQAYNPESRTGFETTRREWRVLDLLAPSLKLHPNANVFPFSVKPDKPVSPEKVMELFRDTFEGTDFDMVKDLTMTDDAGKTVKSPLANPFMPYEMNKLLKINGGWGWRGERPVARWYCMYRP